MRMYCECMCLSNTTIITNLYRTISILFNVVAFSSVHKNLLVTYFYIRIIVTKMCKVKVCPIMSKVKIIFFIIY